MEAASHLHIKPYEDSDKSQLLAYTLPAEQLPFTALPGQVLERIAARNAQGDYTAFPLVILKGASVIGMFVLDTGPDRGLWTTNTHAVFLRSLSINPAFQNQGIGAQVMSNLPEYLEQHMPELAANEIVLGVNRQNHIAQRLYTRIGFNEYGFNMNPPFVGQIIMKWRW